MQVNLVNQNGFSWFSDDRVSVKGFFFVGDVLYTGLAAVEYFNSNTELEQFIQTVSELNGSFAIVIKNQDQVFAAVDRLRSIPLFYSQIAPYQIADTAKDVWNSLSVREIDSAARIEFLLAGYTIGNGTLVSGVNQLQAGQILYCDNVSSSTKFYYRHVHDRYWNKTESEYFDDLYAISERVIERLVTSCRGKTLVVPLSGGYDSRFIAAMLKKLGVRDVICFTYGRRDSFEVAVSKKVSARLGFDWHFVEYTEEKWREFVNDRDFVEYASNLSSCPSPQDYPALRELTSSGAIPRGAVVVPGYCGDLLAGSYVPYELTINKDENLKRTSVYKYIYEKHFHYKENCDVDRASDFIQRISDNSLDVILGSEINGFVNCHEEFFTRHRVAKYVVNAVRSSEYFGLEWRMPLWDNELVEYMYKVPLSERLDDKLYDRFLINVLFNSFDIGFEKGSEGKIRRLLKQYCPDQFYVPAQKLWRIISQRMSSKSKIDFNAFSHLASICKQDLELDNLDGRDSPHAVYVKWYAEKYMMHLTSNSAPVNLDVDANAR